ncbi:hypothetical protein AB0F77_39240 [Streptomyces sp. NPDC026672]|uniref:hypothetical protein n=1 Tax=unclassified Streptomyces TaxID=2593676 RepID=UPI0033E6F6BA
MSVLRRGLVAGGLTLTAILLIVLTSILAPIGDKVVDRASDHVPGLGPEKPGPPTVVTDSRAGAYCDGLSWLVPAKAATLRVPEGVEWPKWARDNKAVRADPQMIGFHLQGTSSAEVVLSDPEVVVDKRRPPLKGTQAKVFCGGTKPYRYVEIDLDQEHPTLKPVGADADGRAIDFPYRVTLADSELFAAQAVSTRSDVDWHIEVRWSSAGEHGTLVIDDHGKPFRVTATSGRTAECAWTEGGLFLAGQSKGCEGPGR